MEDSVRIRTIYSSRSDDWATPRRFFEALDREFHFVLDVCASISNRKCPTYFGLDHADSTRRNGLEGAWAHEVAALGGAVWMNPPYGRAIAAWMEKAALEAKQGATIVALVPARTDTRWFHQHVLGTGAQVRYVRGRLCFGEAANSAPFASLLVVFNSEVNLRKSA